MRRHITKFASAAALFAAVAACNDTGTQPGDAAGMAPIDTLMARAPIDTFASQRAPIDTFASARKAPSDTVALIPVDTLF